DVGPPPREAVGLDGSSQCCIRLRQTLDPNVELCQERIEARQRQNGPGLLQCRYSLDHLVDAFGQAPFGAAHPPEVTTVQGFIVRIVIAPCYIQSLFDDRSLRCDIAAELVDTDREGQGAYITIDMRGVARAHFGDCEAALDRRFRQIEVTEK